LGQPLISKDNGKSPNGARTSAKHESKKKTVGERRGESDAYLEGRGSEGVGANKLYWDKGNYVVERKTTKTPLVDTTGEKTAGTFWWGWEKHYTQKYVLRGGLSTGGAL